MRESRARKTQKSPYTAVFSVPTGYSDAMQELYRASLGLFSKEEFGKFCRFNCFPCNSIEDCKEMYSENSAPTPPVSVTLDILFKYFFVVST